MSATPVTIGLSAVAMAPSAGEMAVLTVRTSPEDLAGLPAGPFDADAHRTFELALRDFVTAQTGLAMGYVEQLYTFGDAGRETPQAQSGDDGRAGRVVSVGYLALAPAAVKVAAHGAAWRPWTDFFPYEDWRAGRPAVIPGVIEPALRAWAGADASRRSRIEGLFALKDPAAWRDEPVLERFELLYEAGLAGEASRDRGQASPVGAAALGQAMRSDHRRILATGLGRLRGKLRYRPVIFDLMPETFTLSRLQKAVEAVTGQPLHKQNFRRGVERAGLVEGTGRIETATGGRPAELYRRRIDSDGETRALGLSLPVSR
jgi:hypothetical protein